MEVFLKELNPKISMEKLSMSLPELPFVNDFYTVFFNNFLKSLIVFNFVK